MGRFDAVTLAVLLLSLIGLCACQDPVPHHVPSLLDPNIKRSEILGCLAVWNHLDRSAGVRRNAEASVKRWHELRLEHQS
jgi:hypothetical protein